MIRGKDEAIRLVLTTILAKRTYFDRRHSGGGKNNVGSSIFRAMELTERRLQFTPDVLPVMWWGLICWMPTREIRYKPGAILCNLLLADRDQPYFHQDAVGPSGGNGRRTGDGRRRDRDSCPILLLFSWLHRIRWDLLNLPRCFRNPSWIVL